MPTKNTYRVKVFPGIFSLIGARLIARSYQQPRRHREVRKGKLSKGETTLKRAEDEQLYEDSFSNFYLVNR